MEVQFVGRDPGAERMRELAVNRVRFVMRRLSWLVPRATVRFSDTNGPRGGPDKHCRIELRTHHRTVVTSSLARDWRTALDAALSRATQAVLRVWKRGHVLGRKRARALPLH